MPPQVGNGRSSEATAGLQEHTCEALQASLRDAPKGRRYPALKCRATLSRPYRDERQGDQKHLIPVGQHLYERAGFAARLCSEVVGGGLPVAVGQPDIFKLE